MSNNWEKFGDQVRKTVQDAVENQNYERLNQMISDTLDQAAQTVKTKYNGYKTYTTDFEHARNASKEAFGSYQKKKQVPLKVQTKTPSKVGTVVMTVLGYALGTIEFVWFLIILAAAFFMEASAGGGARAAVGIFLFLAALWSGLGFFAGVSGTRKLFRIQRFKEYLSEIGTKEYCNVSDLAGKVGKTSQTVLKDVEYMIRKRWFLQGHLDEQKTCLMVSDRMYEEYQQLQRQRLIEKEETKKSVSETMLPPEVQKVVDQGNVYIQKIRKCNDDIPGEEISEKIYRIEVVVDKIFDRVEQNPKNVSDIRKLMEYYLPTTVKLLEAYAQMDAQPVGGENIQTAKKEIEDTLDTLNAAFEKLLDDLFQETAWDVSSDISVLNTMLAQEGLKEDGLKGK